MAASEPQLPSPLDGVPHPRGGDRRTNASPPPAQSKRDKKRQVLLDRLAALSEKYTRDRDNMYREQLHKIQLDTNLVMQVDPYVERPLDAVKDQNGMPRASEQDSRSGGRSVLEMAGPTFYNWYQEIEDLIEERDFELSKQFYEYDKKAQEHKNVHTYKLEVAKREHDAQYTTIRDRLVNSITAKKLRLAKDKESIDISDHHALYLHPNQFSINNPASPGGTHSKRATRLRQNADDLSGMGDSKKRKRAGADDDGSPAPQRRAADMTGTTPFWQGDRLAYRKTTGPVYSLSMLFTDKELSMTHNTASLAAHKHLLTHKGKANGTGPTSSSSDSESSDNEEGNQDGTESLPSTAMMERVPSHATRSTRAGAQNQNFVDDKLVGLEALANFEMPPNLEKMIASEPKLPPMFLTTYAKPPSKAEANTPTTLPVESVNSDLYVMKLLQQYEHTHGAGSNLDTHNGSRKVLEAAAFSSIRDNRYVAYLQHEKRDTDELRKDLKIPTSSVRDEPITPSGSAAAAITAPIAAAVGASPMSRQSSQGGAVMSRQASGTRAQRKRLQ